MSKPTTKIQRSNVRLAKNLKDLRNQRIMQEFKFGLLDDMLTVHTDSDWAGCRSSRKSTSGGVVSANLGVMKHESSTQRLVVLSCEAELFAMNTGAAEAMASRVHQGTWSYQSVLFPGQTQPQRWEL